MSERYCVRTETVGMVVQGYRITVWFYHYNDGTTEHVKQRTKVNT